MELEGVVQNGVIVPDDTTALPERDASAYYPCPNGKAEAVRRKVRSVQGGRKGSACGLGRST